jgi:hypothetical protein
MLENPKRTLQDFDTDNQLRIDRINRIKVNKHAENHPAHPVHPRFGPLRLDFAADNGGYKHSLPTVNSEKCSESPV